MNSDIALGYSLPPDPGGIGMVGPSYKLLLDQEETSEDTARPLQATALIVLSVVGSGANILVAIVFHRRPALRSPSNRFVLSLVLANLMTSFIVVPILLVQVLHQEVAALSWLRHVSSGLTTLAVTAAIFSVLAIAVDRYNAVLSPLHYAMTITRGRSRAMIAGAWGVAGLLATPPFLGALLSPVPATVAVHYSNCTGGDEGEVFRLTYALVLVTLGFTLPLFALCWIYARMYNAAHRNSERTRRHSISANPGEVVASRGGSLDLSVPPASSGTPENFRRPWKSPPLSIGMPKRRPSNASFSALLFREEGRAVKTAAMVITSYLFCWTPYFVTLLIDTWGGVGATVDSYTIEANLVPEPFRSLALLTALSSGCVTPFIYVFRNEAARNEAVKVLLWWRPRSGKYGGNVARCSRDFETYSSNGKAIAAGNSFGPPPIHHDNFALRRQSLSYCDSVSVQSFHIPTAALTSSSDCHHCLNANGPGTADFVATYEVIESPNGDETQQNVGENPSTGKPVAKTRRESVTFRLAFLPQRRCQTCIRQSSDSSSGSGHPLVRHSDGTDGRGTPPVTSNPMSSLVKMTVSQRRQQFLIGRQGSSGEELTPGSDSETPHHMISVDRQLVDYGEEATSLDIPQQVFPQNNNNNDLASSKNGGVMLELEEQTNDGVRTGPRSAAMFQFQETSLERFSALSASLENCMPVDPEVMVTRQDSGHSDTTVRQDSNFSDVTVDSGVVPDLVPFNHSQSSSSSISTASFSAPPRPKRHRHKLQRLAAVEDEDMAPPLEESIPAPALRTVKSRLKSSFKSRFYRPAFRIPKCDF